MICRCKHDTFRTDPYLLSFVTNPVPTEKGSSSTLFCFGIDLGA